MKGWYRDNYRHSLAARHIITGRVDLKRYSGTWDQKSVEPTPWFQRGCKNVKAKYSLRSDGKVDVVNTCDGKEIKGVARSVSKDNRHLKVSFGFPYPEGDYNIEELDKDYSRAKVTGGGYTWELERRRRRAMAERDYRYIGQKDEDPKEFIHNNVDGHYDDHRLEHFWQGATHCLFRPADDLDNDWLSFNRAAGNGQIELSDNPVERYQERGAALVGRVVTIANVEPLLDHGADMSFRDTMMDLAFGRNLR
jgi:lipocalin